MNTREMTRALLGLALACTAIGAPPASAQQDPATPAASASPVEPQDPSAIDEILVTARKREENIQDTPISISAFSGVQLQGLDVRRIQDVTRAVPNLAFDPAVGSSSQARITLRGVGTTDPIASRDPGVGIYLDGVYLARAQGALLTASDLERIEVLRGPQGTLFGKNTIGGAIQVITRKPDLNERDAYTEVRLGNYGRFDTRFGLNLPLVPERAGVRLAFATAHRDGFFKNESTGPDMGDDKLLGGRAQLRWLPTERSQLDLSFDQSREHRKPRGPKCRVTNPAAPGLALAPPGFLAACALSQRTDPFKISSELSFEKDYLDTLGSAATYSWDINDSLTFRSITAWRRQDLDERTDLDGTSISLAALDSIDAGHEKQNQWSQEFQLVGSALGGQLHYVAGLYGFKERNDDRGYFGISPGAPVNGAVRLQDLKVDNLSYAAFFQTTYDFSERWSADLGLRRTSEWKRVDRIEQVVRAGLYAHPCNGLGVAPVQTAPDPCNSFDHTGRFSDWSPLARLSYRPTRDLHFYAGWSRGFKSGGFNGRADDPVLQTAIEDEKVNSYEIGFKSSWLDDHLHINAAAFDTIYENIQLTIPGAGTGPSIALFVTNAGKALIRGGELEIVARPFAGLQLASSLGVTNAHYVKFDDLSPGVNLPGEDLTPEDNGLLNVPNYTLNFRAEYEFALGNQGTLSARADWSHIGKKANDVEDNRSVRTGKYGLLGAQLVWSLRDGKTEISLWGNNLLNRVYLANGIDFGDSFANAQLYYGDPRTYGVELRRKFF